MYVIYHSSDAFAEVTGVSIISLFEELFSKLRSTMKSCMNMQNAGL